MKAVLFDMDGVLVDVAGSYRRAIDATVAHFTGAPPPPGRVQAMKDAGGFNDDWHLSHTLIAEAGVDVPQERVVETFQGIYLGQDFDGLIAHEPPAITTGTLEALAARYRLAVVTGRPEADAAWTLARFGWDRLLPVVVGMGQQAGRGKPDPYGLELALEALGVRPDEACYVGDSVDDQRAARAAGVYPIGVVPPGHPEREHARTLMLAGAEVVLSRTDDLPLLLAALERREDGHEAGENV